MTETLMGGYLLLTLLVFCVVAATSKRPYGRGTTGEADFEAAIFFALLWPVLAFILAAAYIYSIAEGKDDE